MSEEAQVKSVELADEDRQLKAMEFWVARSLREEQNEFVTAYLKAFTEKLEKTRELHQGQAISLSVLTGMQCAAFLVACGQFDLPIPDAVQMLRDFVQFVDDGLAHWR